MNLFDPHDRYDEAVSDWPGQLGKVQVLKQAESGYSL